ncbi:putative integral membrane protein [Owenweeksia hongkongensis DSM 17368]|uniref:Putative integral membrane protein n=1 Tax=Owenweeksia hongkongensis (strain DSM 17368 / CIP 108786 / JCM 12287 / NRRL B-23963 / UST20020801) TaxID=926562 RepID=G8R7Y0_OWEHD|nr:helix-turn-helix domain-containing protein [Owenweeksia hongkongensis]AEV31303.1 putative integral membrane protein [Owenweeksia hongkongensis DSM 17368]
MISEIPERSIAVLPFLNLSTNQEDEYFSDGITEEIINALSLIDGLKVIARTSVFSLKGKDLDAREIGNKLGVNLLLEGSLRKAANKVRISVQLVTAENGFRIWTEKYDRELDDIFAIQDEIANCVLERLQLELEVNFTSTNYTQNTEAYQLLLKGIYFFKRDFDGNIKALEYFKKATELAPDYGEAYAYMGETLIHHAASGIISTIDAHEQARAYAYTALGLNQYDPRAHKVLAFIHLFYDWNWDAAIESYQKAVRYGLPNQNDFITYYHIFLENDVDKAIEIAQKLLETDPLHFGSYWQVGISYYFAARFEPAIEAFNKAIELEPSNSETYHWKSTALGFLKKFDEAKIASQKAIALSENNPWAHFSHLILKILLGQEKEVLQSIKSQEFIDPMDPALLYAMMGLKEEAFAKLEEGYKAKSVMMVTLKHYWMWDSIRDDERFEEMLERMNFPKNVRKDQVINARILPISSNQEQIATDTPDPETLATLEQLKQLMDEDEIYLNPSLSLRELAQSLQIHPNKLSWLINENLGKNFNEYINSWRLTAFQQKALDPENSNITLLGLAYESGFNSKSVFNEFFKRSTGLTPRAWLKSRQA